MRTLTALLSLTLLTCPVWADDSALRRCRALAEPTARLACYDALPLGAPVAAVVSSAAARGSAPASPPTAAAFGLQRPDEVVQEVVSTLPGLFEGWRSGDRIRLANGQLWQVTDDSSGVYYLRDPKVTVRRAALGSFVLDIEGARRQPRVRRLE